ncbi:MAG: alpha/beta hydrolase [Asticcacaulis sp.]|uniref:alpha/beta hydrolase n=1 Tax=Asticcacaulis sp. TaxID=1872648 RepID=UPI0039E5FD90
MLPSTEETFAGKGGLTIFYRSWLPAAPPRAVILLSHGFNAHSGQYGWVAGELVNAGYAVYAGDLRGRGKSEGPRFYVDSFNDYVADLAGVADIARVRHPGLKLFVLGHSAGGVVAVTYTLDNPDKVAGLICESFAYRVPAPEFALDFLTFLSNFIPKAGALKLNNAFFSRDPAVVKALNADPLIANETQPMKTVGEMWKADRRLKTAFGRIATPTLILHGTEDKATSYPGSEEFYKKSGATDKTLKLYEGHYHDLLADTGKAEVMGDILSWLNTRV